MSALNRRHSPGPRRISAVGAGCLLASLAACTTPASPPVPTLDSPVALAAVRWCNVTEADGTVRFAEADACDNITVTTRTLVANNGHGDIQVLNSDLRAPRWLDFDRGTPGNTGISVGDGPVSIAAGPLPATALVGSEREPSLSLVDAALGRRIAGPIPVVETPRQIERLPGTPYFVYSQRRTPALVVVEVRTTCDGQPDVHTDQCDLDATITERQRITLDAPPRSFALHSDGRVFVTRDSQPELLVLDLNLQQGVPTCSGDCEIDRWSLTTECRDGLDNDGDGLADVADPQCFEANGAETPNPDAVCADGVDNDGDGATDADDADCLTPEFASEGGLAVLTPCTDGFDSDLDGLVDGDDPGCEATEGSSEFERGVYEPPSDAGPMADCRDGRDNDGDGLTDWPDDTDCYAAWSEGEGAPRALVPTDVALTETEGLALVLDASTSHLLLFDTATGERLRPNDNHPIYTNLGIPVLGAQTTHLVTYRYAIARQELTDGNVLTVTDEVAHATVTQGFADPLLLERTFEIQDEEGSTVRLEVENRYSRTDLEGDSGRVRLITCDVPRNRLDDLGLVALSCGDERLPQPEAVVPDALGDVSEETDYTQRSANAYLALPELQTWRVNDEGSGITETTIPDDYRVTEDQYSLVWEGELPGTQRTDALVTNAGEWVELLGADPCQRDRDVCSIGLDLSECPVAQQLCDQGADLCTDDLNICGVCPSACGTATNFCQLGVVPGDRLIFDRRAVRLENPDCAPWLTGGVDSANRQSAEYEIVTVQPDRVRIAPVPETDASELVDYLPPADCVAEPVAIRVRGQGLIWSGRNTGHASPFRAVGDQCVVRDDAERRIARVPLDAPVELPQQFGMQINSGTLPPVRDFRISFDVRSGFSSARTSSLFFVLGPSTSAVVHLFTRFGHRVVFADDSQNYVWTYNGTTYQGVGGPLP